MGRFDYFVILADMRTGSNFLETNLNSFAGIACHGEAFNPSFVGYPGRTELLGITQEERDRDPASLINAIRAGGSELGGFRYFSDHDPRVLELVLADARCGKIILTRNPVESYVSRKIATRTGQWKLTNVVKARSERVVFDPAEFESYLQRLQDFQSHILRKLQRTGQTAFILDYEDLRDLEVMNGIAMFLGSPARIEVLDRRLKKQNPEPLKTKVRNFDEMEAALSRIDRFNLRWTPSLEPRRGPAMHRWSVSAESPLLFLPLGAGPEVAIRDWLARLDGGLAPAEGFSHEALRAWKDSHPGHRSFAVLRHPLARAHAAFCDGIISTGPGALVVLREALCRRFGMVIPEPDDEGHLAHRAAFRTFLVFLKAHLGGQTNLGMDPSLASQLAHLQGISQHAPPDMILREERLAEDLALVLWQIGREDAPEIAAATDPHAQLLAKIVDDDLQVLAEEAYGRDFAAFGFGRWKLPAMLAGPTGSLPVT